MTSNSNVTTNGNERKRWGRRLGVTIAWGILLVTTYYIVLFTGNDLVWFTEFAKFMTLGHGFLVGGLTVTDVALKGVKR